MPPRQQPPALQYRRDLDTPAPTVANEPEGVVEAVVSVTGTVDEVGDLIVPGAYTRTLAARLPKVIREHQWQDRVGRVLHIYELMPGDPRLPARTGRGEPWPREAGALVATIQFNLDSDLGRSEFSNVRFYDAEQQWSIGYKVVPAKTRLRRDGVRVIGDLDLWEISTVLWGAHLDTLSLQVKSARQDAADADKDLRDAVDTDAPAGEVAAADDAAEDADKVETGLVADQATALDVGGGSGSVAARKRAAQKLRAVARARARRAKDEATLVEMDRRDEWDRAIELETLAEQERRSQYRRRYKLTRTDRNRRVDLAEDERVRRARWKAQMARWVRVEKARRRKWSMSMRARSDAVADVIRDLDVKTAAGLVAQVKGGVPGVADTPEDRKAVRRLIRWYERGEGAALIQWGVEGDHYRCVAIAGKHMTTEQAHGFCNLRHKGATGSYSGDHDGDGKPDHLNRKTHPGGLEWKNMVQMRGSFEERQRKLDEAVQAMFCPKPRDAGDGMMAESGWSSIDATFDTRVYVTVYKDGGTESFEVPYSFDTAGEVTLGEPGPVELSVVARPEDGVAPEPMSETDASAARYLTPVLTGYGELALATKTAALGLEGKGAGWKTAIADAVRTLVSAAEDAGISLDDPDEPTMDDTDLDDEDIEPPAGGVPYEDTTPITDDTDEDADTEMPGMDEGTGFGVLGDTGTDTGDDADTDDGDLDDEGAMDAPLNPDEPGVPGPDDTPDSDADDDGELDGMEPATTGAPADQPAASGDPTADQAEAGDTYTNPDDDDDDEEGKWMQRKTLTLDPSDVIGTLEALRHTT